jgi:hypothetical protein
VRRGKEGAPFTRRQRGICSRNSFLIIPAPAEMNWTGGSLQRTKIANKGVAQKQRAHFARARMHLQNGPTSPAAPFHPSFLRNEDRPEPGTHEGISRTAISVSRNDAALLDSSYRGRSERGVAIHNSRKVTKLRSHNPARSDFRAVGEGELLPSHFCYVIFT